MDCGRATSIPAISSLNKVNPHGRAHYGSFHRSIVHAHEEQAGAERTAGEVCRARGHHRRNRLGSLVADSPSEAWRQTGGREEGVWAVFPAGRASPALQLPLGSVSSGACLPCPAASSGQCFQRGVPPLPCSFPWAVFPAGRVSPALQLPLGSVSCGACLPCPAASPGQCFQRGVPPLPCSFPWAAASTALVLTGVWQHHLFFVSYYGLNRAPLPQFIRWSPNPPPRTSGCDYIWR